MKKENSILKSAAVALLVLIIGSSVTLGITPFYFSGRNTDGSPFTNVTTMTFWPPAAVWVSNGTNMIWGGTVITNTPNATGFFSNSVFSGTYKVAQPALGSSAYFYAAIADTTNYQSLNLYATNVPVSGGVQTSAGVIAGMLGFTPVANTFTAVSSALGYTAATNLGPIAVSQLPYTPATNGSVGTIASLGFQPATNGATIAVAQLPYALITTNIAFVGPNTTNTLYVTNSVVQRMSTP